MLDKRLDQVNERQPTHFRADHVGLVFQESYRATGAPVSSRSLQNVTGAQVSTRGWRYRPQLLWLRV